MFQRGWRTLAAASCAVAMWATPAAAAAEGPGAPGAGDPYFPGYGNGGYDVSHYDIQVRYQPENDHLRGTTTIVAEPTQDLTRFNLDFALNARSVLVNGEPARFRQNGLELVVTPADVLAEGDRMTVVVRYDGVPSSVEVDGTSPWLRTSDGALAVGQPEISSWWFPGNDHPRDKATYDFAITVPEGKQVLANGVRTGTSSLDGWTTSRWRLASPTATYLTFMAVGDYDVSTADGAFGQPFISAYSNGLGRLEGPAKASVERTPEVLRFLSDLLGPYPFGAQGGVVASEKMTMALENQTRPTYGKKFFEEGANLSVVVHENAHQWFGDSVAVDTWRDIWLNEGFATYASWMWSEAQGNGTAQQLFDQYYSSIPADDPFWKVTPGDPGAENVFHDAVYDRGAMAVHALRTVMGDRALLDTVRDWVKAKRGGNGTVEEFMALAEKHSGQQLDEVFRTWLFTPAKPRPGAATGVPDSAVHGPASVPRSYDEIQRTNALLHSTGEK